MLFISVLFIFQNYFILLISYYFIFLIILIIIFYSKFTLKKILETINIFKSVFKTNLFFSPFHLILISNQINLNFLQKYNCFIFNHNSQIISFIQYFLINFIIINFEFIFLFQFFFFSLLFN